MIFHDFLDDRQSKSGSLGTGRNIRFGETFTMFNRKPTTIIGNRNKHTFCFIWLRDRYFDPPRWQITGIAIATINRLSRVLQRICQTLINLTWITWDFQIAKRIWIKVIRNLCMRLFLKKNSALNKIGYFLWTHFRRRHPGEAWKLVNHTTDVWYLTNDRIGTGLEHFLVVANLLEVTPLKPFSRKLDRGKRVFDLMGDATCNIGPGSHSLGSLQLSDIIKCDDIAENSTIVRPFSGNTRQKSQIDAISANFDLARLAAVPITGQIAK